MIGRTLEASLRLDWYGDSRKQRDVVVTLAYRITSHNSETVSYFEIWCSINQLACDFPIVPLADIGDGVFYFTRPMNRSMELKEPEGIVLNVVWQLADRYIDRQSGALNHSVVVERNQKYRLVLGPLAPQLVEKSDVVRYSAPHIIPQTFALPDTAMQVETDRCHLALPLRIRFSFFLQLLQFVLKGHFWAIDRKYGTTGLH